MTNDDGIGSPGLRALYFALKNSGHNVFVAAPMSQQSGVGHSLTVFEPLRIKKISENGFEGTGIYGTPTDCVKLALGSLVDFQPDLVIAGINDGQNVGPDINYSGTVGAAAEAAHASIPSMAVSRASGCGEDDLEAVARHAVGIAEKIQWEEIPAGRVINVNYPGVCMADARDPVICPQSSAVWQNVYDGRRDPQGSQYWWLVGDIEDNPAEFCDRILLARGHITITPLKFEFTDHDGMDALKNMSLEK